MLAGLLSAALLVACGGGGGGGKSDAELAPKTLSIALHSPSQVRSGEAFQINGSLDPNGALPSGMEWQLLERPADSQARLSDSHGSSELLYPDRPGRYVVQWTVIAADGARAQKQVSIEAIDGPLIQTSGAADQLRLGQATLLQASLPPTESEVLTTYRWTLLQGPSGSKAQLSAAWGSEVSLNADVAGEYQVQVESRQGDTVSKTVRTLSASAVRTLRIYATGSCSFMVGCNIPLGASAVVTPWAPEGLGDAKVSYRWTLASKPAGSKLGTDLGSGATAVFVPDVIGTYGVEMQATSSDLNFIDGGRSYLTVPVVAKPVGSIEAPGSVQVGQVATLESKGNRTYDGKELGTIQRTWTLLKAPKGSSAVIQPGTLWESTAKLRPDRPGDYVVSLSFYQLPDYATITIKAIAGDPSIVYPPKLLVPANPLVPGEEVQLKAESPISELGHTIQHEWNFGDGSKATGDEVTHSYAYPGTYLVQVVARDLESQRIARQTATITVVANRLSNIPPVPCKLAACPAAAADLYAGEGVGRWQLWNDQPHAQLVNIDIAGVRKDHQVMVSLSNTTGTDAGLAQLGQSQGMKSRPIVKTSNATAQLSATQVSSTVLQRRDAAHAEHLERDRALSTILQAADGGVRIQGGRRTIQSSAARAPLPVPDIGSKRDWKDNIGSGLVYDSRLMDSCSMPSGRKILFWRDEKARTNELLGDTQIADDLKPIVCGAQGGFHKLQQLLRAEVFGLHERERSAISDAALQPVQIALVDPGPNQYWGAYVYSGDLALKSSQFQQHRSRGDVCQRALHQARPELRQDIAGPRVHAPDELLPARCAQQLGLSRQLAGGDHGHDCRGPGVVEPDHQRRWQQVCGHGHARCQLPDQSLHDAVSGWTRRELRHWWKSGRLSRPAPRRRPAARLDLRLPR